MNADELRASLLTGGLARIADAVIAQSAESIRLRTTPIAEGQLPLGATKIGGQPDLAPGVAWPAWQGVPQSFIAQIALPDLAPYAASRVLPTTGLLSFFSDAEQLAAGYDPGDRGGWLVTYTDAAPRALRRTPRPGGDSFAACAVRFAPEVTLPMLDVLRAEFDLTDGEVEAYWALDRRVYPPDGSGQVIHRLLGHPQPIQDDMRTTLQFAASVPGPPAAGAADWRLLLQVDSDDAARMMWGDVGRLYYWLPAAALARRDFSAAWLILQCS
ncbi:MAG TPA: YwqG family protein [Acetobacteraceae bacterium]|nr:YwqG family protein [Acetobacteraceae bacterium]